MQSPDPSNLNEPLLGRAHDEPPADPLAAIPAGAKPPVPAAETPLTRMRAALAALQAWGDGESLRNTPPHQIMEILACAAGSTIARMSAQLSRNPETVALIALERAAHYCRQSLGVEAALDAVRATTENADG